MCSSKYAVVNRIIQLFRIRNVVQISCIVYVLLFTPSCVLFRKSNLKVVSVERIEYLNHVVKRSGETLIEVSNTYTGSSKNWKLILSYNPQLDVRRIRVGTKIKIPLSIIKPSKQLPVNRGDQGKAGVTSQKPAAKPQSNISVLPKTNETPKKEDKKVEPKKSSKEVELLPMAKDDYELETFEESYDVTPFEDNNIRIIPEDDTPSPTVEEVPVDPEEKKLTDEYRELMKQLDAK